MVGCVMMMTTMTMMTSLFILHRFDETIEEMMTGRSTWANGTNCKCFFPLENVNTTKTQIHTCKLHTQIYTHIYAPVACFAVPKNMQVCTYVVNSWSTFFWDTLYLFGTPCTYLGRPVLIWGILYFFGTPCTYHLLNLMQKLWVGWQSLVSFVIPVLIILARFWNRIFIIIHYQFFIIIHYY